MSDSNEIVTISSVEIKPDIVLQYMQSYLRDFYNEECYKWQYLKKMPEGGLFFLQSNNTIICSQGMIPIELIYKNNVIKSAKSESSFLQSEFRGKQLFERLYFETIEKCENEGIYFFWGFTLLGQVWKNKLKFEVGEIFYESKVLISYKSALNQLFVHLKEGNIKKGIRSVAKATILKLKHPFHSNKKSNIRVTSLDKISQEEYTVITNLYKKWNTKFPNNISINMEDYSFFNWRINENPSCRYHNLIITSEDKTIGFAVINILKDTIYLVECIIPEPLNHESVTKALLNYLRKNYNSPFLSYLGNIKNNYSNLFFNQFNKMGADARLVEDMKFVFKRTNNSKEQISYESFYLNGLWTEGFKI